ncbi:MAG: putative baseplate assembly protein [Planctomycetes bacterium]|nr:putative baseplate assembly protein [Planctomycetota bacterium]
MTDSRLDPCGCCEGTIDITPLPVQRPPDLRSLSRRTGNHGAFRAAMIAALARTPGLSGLTTRDPSDPAIALLDAWAAVLDVLSFHGERAADEAYLGTATERLSVRQLARLIGYELGAGVSASTHLAVTTDEMAGAPAEVTLPAGTRVQSMPVGDAFPQTFETAEELTARPEWNALRARTTTTYQPAAGDAAIHVAGTATALRVGDALLIVGPGRRSDPTSGQWVFRRVGEVRIVDAQDGIPGHTIVTLDSPLPQSTPGAGAELFALRQRANLFGYNAVPWEAVPTALRLGEVDPQVLQIAPEFLLAPRLLLRAGAEAAVAGNAEMAGNRAFAEVQNRFLPGFFKDRRNDWADATFPQGSSQIDLDQVQPAFVIGGWLMLRNTTHEEVYRITLVQETARTDFMLAGQVTRLTLAGKNLHHFSPKAGVVFGASERLEWGERPITAPVQGLAVTVAGRVKGLTKGRLLAITGTRADTGAAHGAVVDLERIEDLGNRSRLHLGGEIGAPLLPLSVRISANVVPATHGETKTEVLGSGDATLPFQTFKLAHVPLTYISAPVPSGRRSTLAIRVNDVLWHEAASFHGQPPDARIYVVRHEEDGSVLVRCGDGVHGARLPTGKLNVTASYRSGTGLAGNVAAGTITQPLTRPLGLFGVTNPVPATGGEDAETMAVARRNAPLAVTAMGRIVSLTDHEDFARAFAGIGKAQAQLLWLGEQSLVHLTVATADGRTLLPSETLYRSLVLGIDAVRHAAGPVHLAGFDPLTFDLRARLVIEQDHDADVALAAARAALVAAFAFDVRDFAQTVNETEVHAVLQAVAGVTAVILETLHVTGAPAVRNPRLFALPARVVAGEILPAQLLTVRTSGITLLEDAS